MGLCLQIARKDGEEMTDHKFTDETIIKAVEHCFLKRECDGCPLDRGESDASCIKDLHSAVLDLIKRQKTEIERLNTVLSNEAIVPPVKIGQTVYSALAYDDEEDTIEEYTVDGLGYIDGEWFVWCEKDTDWYRLGTEYCKLTREDAEKVLAERGKK